jgi:hypothetical protein
MRSAGLAALIVLLPAAAAAQQPAEARARAAPPAATALQPALDSLGADIAALDASHGRLMEHLRQQGVIHRDLAAQVAALPDPPTGTDAALADAVRALKRDAAQSGRQYEALGERAAAETRRYTTLSNVLKSRHDTAKNSIGNIR